MIISLQRAGHHSFEQQGSTSLKSSCQMRIQWVSGLNLNCAASSSSFRRDQITRGDLHCALMASSELTRAAFATAVRSQDDISSLLLAKRRLQSRVESQEAELEQLRSDLRRERFVNACVDFGPV